MKQSNLTEKEKGIARHLQGDLYIESHPFRTLGDALGLEEEEVIRTINHLKQQGIIRKITAIVRHQRVGYEKNAMVVWAVPSDRTEAVGLLFASFKEISHCYERTPPLDGRYNLFTMVHIRKDKPADLIQRLAVRSGIHDFKVLLSVEEFKKSSMTYF